MVMGLGMHWTKISHNMPMPRAKRRLSKIESKVSKKFHFSCKLIVCINFSWAALSLGEQNPPNLPKLTEAEYILGSAHEGTLELVLQLS